LRSTTRSSGATGIRPPRSGRRSSGARARPMSASRSASRTPPGSTSSRSSRSPGRGARPRSRWWSWSAAPRSPRFERWPERGISSGSTGAGCSPTPTS